MKSLLVALSLVFSVGAFAVDYNGTYSCNDGSTLNVKMKRNGESMRATLDFSDGYASTLAQITFDDIYLTGDMLDKRQEVIGYAKFDTIGKRIVIKWRSNPEKIHCSR